MIKYIVTVLLFLSTQFIHANTEATHNELRQLVGNIENAINLTYLGSITSSSTISKASKYRLLFSHKYPNSVSSYELNEIIKNLAYKLEHKVLYSKGRKSFAVFVRRLIEKF